MGIDWDGPNRTPTWVIVLLCIVLLVLIYLGTE